MTDGIKQSYAGFAELAATYDARLAGNPLYRLESGEVLAALPDLTGKHVADFGCGTGRYALQMARSGATTVTGIDCVPQMLQLAQAKAEHWELPVTWLEGDVTQHLPVADGTFSLGVCGVVLSFLPDPLPALREMARTLEPGGTLIVSDYHPHGLREAAQSRILARGQQTHGESGLFLRFTSEQGQEQQIPQYAHLISTLFSAAHEAGLTLTGIREPVCDERLARTYANLSHRIGIPLALILEFCKYSNAQS